MSTLTLPIHLVHAERLITEYRGTSPFSPFLKNYFRAHKKLGSRDRRIISALCYQWFRDRIFRSQPVLGNEDRSTFSAPFHEGEINKFAKEWGMISPTYFQKLQEQPTFWIRVFHEQKKIRELLREVIVQELSSAGDTLILEIKADAKLEKLLPGLDFAYRIQDISSQRILENISPDQPIKQVWDCCAGGGGKSLLLDEFFPGTSRYASDVRKQALENLQQRFSQEKRTAPQMAVVDLSITPDLLPFPKPATKNTFDLLVADVPCSGSGTWRRNPEHFSFFSPGKLQDYVQLQRAIVRNALSFLAPGGTFIYVTCSAFAAENEQQVNFFLQQHSVKLLSQTYLEEGDTLFRAVLQRL